MTSINRPAISGFHPDPTLCRAGTRYFLANSSFEYFPGAPIFASDDALAWDQIGNVLTRRTQFARGDGRPSGGIFGSTLRYHDGTFWFITTNMSDFGAGHLVVHTDDPRGPWSEPVFISGAIGIDPDIAWDDGGTCYLTWCGFGPTPQQSGIVQARVNLEEGILLEPPYRVWQGTGLAYPEGPHLYQRDSYWYLLLAEGGTERGHTVTIARCTSPAGPFVPCPANPILTHRSLPGAVQNVGHADLLEREDGSWVAAYLGVRIQGSSPGFHVIGRETFVCAIDWSDDWPVFVEGGVTIPTVDHSFSDDFVGDLDPRWISPSGDPASIARSPLDGGLELMSSIDGGDGSLLCTRVRDLSWSASVTVDAAGGGVRMVVRIDDRHWYGVEVRDGRVRAMGRVGDLTQEFAERDIHSPRTVLRISTVVPVNAGELGGNVGPDDIVLGFDGADGFVELARLDGRYISTEVAGGFTGRMIGLGALTTHARVLSFSYKDSTESESPDPHDVR
ncbi:glycoside hydrolase family 43 protein [Subtercola frigoramans]|uniref:glycoside hydrolase family 43 protein n=1 Tax=Subtercola frigoramans TaxID=120298 RepID=UPI001961433C